MIAIRSTLPGLAAVVLLAGCVTIPTDTLPVTNSPAPQGSCGAEKVSSYVGTMMNDEVRAKIKSASGTQILRVVGPHDAMTMDFRENRLTITTDDAGRIKTLRCV